jgi:hypothetical protein
MMRQKRARLSVSDPAVKVERAAARMVKAWNAVTEAAKQARAATGGHSASDDDNKPLRRLR